MKWRVGDIVKWGKDLAIITMVTEHNDYWVDLIIINFQFPQKHATVHGKLLRLATITEAARYRLDNFDKM